MAPKPRHLPQLDGVRAIAIAAVVAYHLGYLGGGWIGVDVFFVLSGYLITSILIEGSGPLGSLGRFWGRRARRLLPAVMLLLVVLSLYSSLRGPGVVPAQLRSPALATAFYEANWQQIIAGSNYFAHSLLPSPFEHTWSLAIEEQYYVVWPLLLGGLIWATRKRPTRLIAATAGLAAASAVWMGVAAHIYGTNRAYLGTDTRAWELLLGGALAMAARPSHRPRPSRFWSLAAPVGLVGVLAGMLVATRPTAWMWDGGLVAIGLASALLIVGTAHAPRNPVSVALSIRPVAWLGLISYSLYLWHWPVIVLMSEDTTGLHGGSLLTARLAAMIAASCFSYYLVERPLRTLDWGALGRRVHMPAPGLALGSLALVSLLVVGSTVGTRSAGSATVSLTSGSLSGQSLSVLSGKRSGLPPASAANPYRVWIFGDSVMVDSSPGITAALDATGDVSVVMNSAFPGWGLTRDPNWPRDAAAEVARQRPQIALAFWSWDDEVAGQNPGAYRARLEADIRTLLAPPYNLQMVLLVQFPQAGPNLAILPSIREGAWARQTRLQNVWDAAARQATAAFPGHAGYLTTSYLFAPDGRFRTWFQTPSGQWIRARKLDNDHFCPYGAASFGALVAADFRQMLGVAAPAPGWELGAWTHEHRYNDPPGACPNDQPPTGYRGLPVPT
jgi:peptidoglycan/LPS O-acetylase OafA/YrhL